MKPHEVRDFCIRHCKHCYQERLDLNMYRVCCTKRKGNWLADEVPCKYYEEREQAD